MNASSSFPTRLSETLHARGMKQRTLARSIGVSENTVSSWVNADSQPRAAHLLRLAQELDVSLDWLNGGPTGRPGEASHAIAHLDREAENLIDRIVALRRGAPTEPMPPLLELLDAVARLIDRRQLGTDRTHQSLENLES